MRSNKNQINKDLQEIADALPDMIPHMDTSKLTGEEIILSGLDIEINSVKRSETYDVRFLHWRPHNHFRSLKQLVRKANTPDEKKRAVLDYINKYQINGKA